MQVVVNNNNDLKLLANSSVILPHLNQIFICCGNSLGFSSVIELLNAIPPTRPDISFTSIGVEVVRFFEEALNKNSTLTHVVLVNDSVGNEGASDLALSKHSK
ncbi:hypothetical protein GEMRC1_013362 [Eukaryota sp. GEM-RC1]